MSVISEQEWKQMVSTQHQLATIQRKHNQGFINDSEAYHEVCNIYFSMDIEELKELDRMLIDSIKREHHNSSHLFT